MISIEENVLNRARCSKVSNDAETIRREFEWKKRDFIIRM